MSAEPVSRPRRGISIFRAEQAVPLGQSDFMLMPEMSEAALAARGPDRIPGTETGGDVRVAVRQTPEEGGFSILHVWFKPNYPLPRHSHDADCLYYLISGSLIMGNQVLRAGDGFFIPGGAPYAYEAGPDGVELLEIRHDVAQFDMQIVESNAAKWAAMGATIAQHREAWEADPVSPTLAANRAGAASHAGA